MLVTISGIFISVLDTLGTVRASEKPAAADVVSTIFKAQYHSWATLLGGEDHKWMLVSGRIFRITLLFVVLIIGATYTANLAVSELL